MVPDEPNPPARGAAPRPIVLVTGLSGAGKASVLKALEDLGFETVDNPPLSILGSLVGDGSLPLAAGIDTRTRGFDAEQVKQAVRALRARSDVALTLVFATAEEPVLLRRYTETRRRHPLAPGGALGSRVADGIARESAILAPLREEADLVIDTSDLPLPDLRHLIESRFRPGDAPGMAVLLQSFAYPKGLPREADLVFDVRFLRNPHYVPALKPLTGRDSDVASYVAEDPDFPGFWQRLTGFLDPLLPRYVAEGKKYLTVAIGCTGGRHRSVLVTERLADHLRSLGWRVDVTHRELADDRDRAAGAAPLAAAATGNGAAAGRPAGGQEAPQRTP
jgi:UPF0042 nucleotide-binding protein